MGGEKACSLVPFASNFRRAEDCGVVFFAIIQLLA